MERSRLPLSYFLTLSLSLKLIIQLAEKCGHQESVDAPEELGVQVLQVSTKATKKKPQESADATIHDSIP